MNGVLTDGGGGSRARARGLRPPLETGTCSDSKDHVPTAFFFLFQISYCEDIRRSSL